MTNSTPELPKGWVLSKLEKVCEVLDSIRIPINSNERNDRISGKPVSSLYPYYGATGQVGFIDNYLFDGEYVLLGEDGAPFLNRLKSKSYIVNGKFWVNNHAHILRAFVSNCFLNHYLNQVDYGNFVTGTTRLKLNQTSMKQIPIKLPPANEQHRIVSKIEELFSDLDNGIDQLKKTQQQLAVYRQAVLKWAFEGKLTKAWREENRPESAEKLLKDIQLERDKKYQEQIEEWEQKVQEWEADGKPGRKPAKPRFVNRLTKENLELDINVYPDYWHFVRLGEIAEIVGGVTKGRKLDDSQTINLPYLRVANVQDGYLDLNQIKEIDVLPEDLTKYKLKNGDILYTEGGDKDKLGRGTIWKGEIENCIHQNHIFRARVFKNLTNPKYVAYFSQTRTAKDYFFDNAKQTVNLASINMTVLSNLPLPLCPYQEQKQIVQEIEFRLSEIEHLENTILKSLNKSEALRQSILKKAFEGKLVPQDPNDEPASELLKRIKAEKKS